MYNLNILPNKYRKQKRLKVNLANPTYGLAILGTVVASSIFLGVQLEMKDNSINEEIKVVEAELQELQVTANTISGHISQIQHYKNEIQRMQNPTDMNMGMGGYPTDDGMSQPEGIAWDFLLDEVAATTIPEATITSVKQSVSNPELVEVNVETYTLSNMARMKQSFEDSKYFSDVSVSNIQQNNTNLIARPNEVSFTLSFKYWKNPKDKEQITNNAMNSGDIYNNGLNNSNMSNSDPYSMNDPYYNQNNGLSTIQDNSTVQGNDINSNGTN